MNIKVLKPRGFQKFFKKTSVEVTAAVDEETNYSSGEDMLLKMQEIQKNIEEAKKKEISETEIQKEENVLQEENSNTMAIENRLDNLQQMLEQRIFSEEKEQKQEEKVKEEPEEESKAEACIRLVREQLLNNEVEEKYADIILDEIRKTTKKDTAIDQILASIYQKIVLKLGQTRLIEGEKPEEKYIFFIGPTGVGKTTTIAKIASNLKIQKKKKVALITSDTYRIAAVEQLRTYANILGLPLKVIYSDEEMKKSPRRVRGL